MRILLNIFAQFSETVCRYAALYNALL